MFETSEQQEQVISVGQLNKLAKTILETHVPIVWIKGEISGLKTYSHIYFDLKDEHGKVSCVFFSRLAALIDFKLENGQQIEVRGKVTIYPQNGSYQINVERIRKVGMGELWEAYGRLIIKLRTEGLFETLYKKAIPIFPKAIGIITSKEGSVIRDVITTLKRRTPNISIIIYHSAVQGTDASMQLSKAIRIANQRNEVDVLIICRGGGSMEDLWCFNEEVVAREVFNSQIPIISAVGHETDTTIIDFVADLRAPTPTAAAELVAKSREQWLDMLNNLKRQLKHHINLLVNNKSQQLDLYYAQLKALSPQAKLKQNINTVKQLQINLQNLITNYLKQSNWRLQLLKSKLDITKVTNIPHQHARLVRLNDQLINGIKSRIKDKQIKLENLRNYLELLNPQNVLSRGYAIVRNKAGNIVQGSEFVKHHERVSITLANDEVSAIIDKKFNHSQEELI